MLMEGEFSWCENRFKCGPNPRSSILIFKEVETLKPTEPPVHPPVQPSVQPPEATTYGPTCHPTCHTLPYTFSGNRATINPVIRTLFNLAQMYQH